MLVLNRKHLPSRRIHANTHLSKADFLFKHAAQALEERIDMISKDFENALVIGARGCIEKALLSKKSENIFYLDIAPIKKNQSCVGDEEYLPFGQNKLDLVISFLNLHSVNDLPGALAQIQYALKPDGVFIAAMIGGESLYELRAPLQRAEEKIYGGISPRLFPFADKQQMGALIQRTGFALPVIDSDIIKVSYKSFFDVAADLKAMGETNIQINRFKGLTSPRYFEAVEKELDSIRDNESRFDLTFEIIYIIGWAPHSSQQQPLKPGSAETSLAQTLETQEEEI